MATHYRAGDVRISIGGVELRGPSAFDDDALALLVVDGPRRATVTLRLEAVGVWWPLFADQGDAIGRAL